ncbi:MAG: serine/threonine protein kinase [Deltaproteobacteria bacterium]|nr:serine/threonine protein kinase [Deltaproteobacteria bacterium]
MNEALGHTVATRVGPYEMTRRVAEEARVIVFEARCTRTGREVWLRLLKPDLAGDPRARAQFHREARALLRLVHPNVVAVIDYAGKDAEVPFIATERLDGKTLQDHIDAGGPVSAAKEIIAQAAAGLAEAHKEGLVHRGVSPAAVFVEASGRAVLTGFSLVGASVATSETFVSQKTAIVVADAFAAPEILRGASPDARSDVYALATTLLHALFGGTVSRTSDAQDAALLAEVAKWRADDPAARPGDASAIAEALATPDPRAAVRAWLGGDTVPAVPRKRAPAEEPGDPKAAFTAATGGRYTLGELLGEGGMGKVYRARDTRLLRDVAVKMITGAVDDEMRRRFHREARAMGKLRHPNIVEVLDYSGQDAQHPFLVLELIDGITLAALMRSTKVPEAAALAIAYEIAAALACVHGEGFVHRDVKPDNVFIDELGRVVLADFGIVRASATGHGATFAAIGSGFSGDTASIGSPYYASPEQIFDPANAGPVSDLFSLGSALQAILTGLLPIDAKNVGECLGKLSRGELRPLSAELSADVAGLVRLLHAKAPKARPESADAVCRDIEGMLAARRVIDRKRELRRFLGLQPDSSAQTYAVVKEKLKVESGARTTETPRKANTTRPLPRDLAPPRRLWPLVAAVVVTITVAALAWLAR